MDVKRAKLVLGVGKTVIQPGSQFTFTPITISDWPYSQENHTSGKVKFRIALLKFDHGISLFAHLLSLQIALNMDNKHYFCTTYLFSNTNFLMGIGGAMNIVGNYYSFNYFKSEKEADYKALRCDWEMVGADLGNVFTDCKIKPPSVVHEQFSK